MKFSEIPPASEVAPERRVVGLETEFGLHFDTNAPRKVTSEEVAGALFHSVVQWGRSSNVFLTNGSRLYIDVGAHPEYATAECDSLTDLIALDKAGERVVGALVEAGEARLRDQGIEGTIHLYKNNADSKGNSYGCHENYLLRRRADFQSFASTLVPFLLSRQVVTGAGCVTHTAEGAHLSFSPRADHMWEALSSSTTRSRPMINTRDEPHAHSDLYRRMHVIVGDSTMAEPTLLLKVGATDLLLRIMEARVPVPEMALEDDMQAIRTIAHDVSGKATVPLQDGRELTGAQIQQTYLDFVRSHVGSIIEPTDEVERILDLWQRGITAVQTGDWSTVSTELDWAIKFALIERYRQRTGADLGDARIQRLEWAFHDVAPGRGLYEKMRAQGLIKTVVDEADIQRAVDMPPQTTRAKIRGDFVRTGLEAGRDFTVDWVHLKIAGHPGSTVLLKDPFRSSDARADALMAALAGQPTE